MLKISVLEIGSVCQEVLYIINLAASLFGQKCIEIVN